ncbi:hypothetical protein DFS34DRAFT_195649 [Phlyctochytrium arcticum]|nr:hypothetical protein DFS34DRAFT_195649 [Phlyctochytrium arcticum]
MFEQYTLNPLQKAAFSMICAPVFARMPCPESERLSIVTGPGGTGKSGIVVAIIQQIEGHFGIGSVKIMAPSGYAAAAIGGTTVHRGIGIPQGATSCRTVKARDHLDTNPRVLIETKFGWDVEKKRPHRKRGIFGHPETLYFAEESQGRLVCHMHGVMGKGHPRTSRAPESSATCVSLVYQTFQIPRHKPHCSTSRPRSIGKIYWNMFVKAA